MRTRESKTPKTRIEAPYIPPTDVVEADLRRFLGGVEHLEDVPLKEEYLMTEFQQVLNNRLKRAIDKVMAHWHYVGTEEHCQDDHDVVYELERLREQLEEMQQARLRDILTALSKRSHS